MRLLAVQIKIKRGERNLVMNTGNGSSVHWIGISSVLKWQNVGTRPIPLLRSLNKLTEPIIVDGYNDGKPFVPMDHIDLHHNFSTLNTRDLAKDPTRYPYTVVQFLMRCHFAINIDKEDYIELE